MKPFFRNPFLLLTAVCFFMLFGSARATEDPKLGKEQMKEFLLHAEVVRSQRIGTGITNPYRLTLSNGSLTHDAAFQPVDERRNFKRFDNGTTEMNFVDSYKYNIAAYRIAGLLGLEDMMPVTVERSWKGMTGSLSWWLSTRMDEGERYEKDIRPPDVLAFNRQMHKVRVFRELVYDSDLNARNVLIGENWELYMIDFSRAFRLYHDLRNAKNLEMCSRDLLEKLKQLDRDTLTETTQDLLSGTEVDGIMARRDRVVEHFKKLIAEKGEQAVLY